MNLHDRDLIWNTRKEALAEGITQGSQQKAIETATNLLKLDTLSAEQISNAVNLPLEQVLELKKQITVNA